MVSWENVLAVLSVPLESLIVLEDQIRFGEIVERWDLSECDRVALREWGLPSGCPGPVEPQTEPHPTLVPNVAGDLECRLVAPDQRLYRLGRWGGGDNGPMVGALAGGGAVLGIRQRPLTVADLHPHLRPFYMGYHQPAVSLISSSVSRYIEVSWRWHAAIKIEMQIEEPNGSAYLQYYAEKRECYSQFLAGLARVDAAIGSDEPQSLWASMVLDDY